MVRIVHRLKTESSHDEMARTLGPWGVLVASEAGEAGEQQGAVWTLPGTTGTRVAMPRRRSDTDTALNPPSE